MVSHSTKHPRGKKLGKKQDARGKHPSRKQGIAGKKTGRVQSSPARKHVPKQVSPQQKIVISPTVRQLHKQTSSGLTEVPDHLPGQKAGTGYRMATDRIDGETVIGDLIVVFPRTREALLRHGLKLDVDEAGDIYMTLGAFSAIHGLKTSALVDELTEVSRQPPPTPSQTIVNPHAQNAPQLASPPSAA